MFIAIGWIAHCRRAMILNGQVVKRVKNAGGQMVDKIVQVHLNVERGDSVVASNEDEDGAPSTIGRSIVPTNLQKNVSALIRKLDPSVAVTDVGDDDEIGSIEAGTPGPVEMTRGRGSSVARSRRGGGSRGRFSRSFAAQ